MSALTSLLARDHVVAVRKIEEALQKQVMAGGDIASVLLELDAIAENTLAAYSAALVGRLPATRDEVMRAPRDVIRVVPREVAEKHRLVPIGIDGGTLLCALSVPLSAELERQLSFLLGHGLMSRVVCEVRVAAALSHHYGIEPTPRMRRLIERLRERDAGPVPYVAPPENAKADHAVKSSLAAKSGAATSSSFLDDDDGPEDAPTPSSSSLLRPSGLPPSDGRTTDPLGVSRDDKTIVDGKSQPPSAVKTQPPPRRVSVPPPASFPPAAATPVVPVSRPPAEAIKPNAPRTRSEPLAPERGALVPPEPTSDLKRAADTATTGFRRLRGPLTALAAAQHLDAAQNRDDILDVFFAFGRQFFDYAALFTIHEDHADGKDAHGAGTSSEEIRQASVGLGTVQAPKGLLGQARARLTPVLGRFAASPEDKELGGLLRQNAKHTAIAVPVAIRARAVLLLVGVRGGEQFGVSDVPELVAFVPRVANAIERIILRKKKGAESRFEKPAAAVADRGELKAAVREARSSVPPRPKAKSSDGWSSAKGASEAPTRRPNDTIPGAARRSPNDTAPDRARLSLAEAILEGAGENAAAPPVRRPSDPPEPAIAPRGLLNIPRSAPPPPEGGFDVPVVTLPPRDSLSRATHPLGPIASSEADVRNTVPAPPPDDDDAPQLSVSAADDDPELSTMDQGEGDQGEGDQGEGDQGEGDQGEADQGEGDQGQGNEEPEARSTQPGPPPVTSVPPAVLIAPQVVSASYSMHDLDEEVVIPLRRSRPRASAPPQDGQSSAPRANSGAPAPRVSAPPDAERNKDPRREGSEGLSSDRVPMRAVERAVGAAAKSSDNRVSQAPPPSGEVPSVIVDMGDAVENLVVDLQHAGPDDERAAVSALLRMGEAALPVLAQTFPGPLWFDRHRPHRRSPRGRDVCAIARAFYAFGVRAIPYVASLISSTIPDKRYYALLLASDMVHPNLLDAVLSRSFDEDESIRKLAHEVAPRFRGLAGWEEQLTIVRRAARIRGKDPKKRIYALQAITAIRDAGALKMLVDLLEDDDREVVRQAHVALVALTAEDLGLSTRKWVAWAEKNSARHRIEWLIDALTHSDEALRAAAGEELKQLTQQYFGFHPGTTRREREVAQEKYRKWWASDGKKQNA